uniref:non-specific serine/threonine protein kinase n=1 Tax=Anthurium amnicola TaxID=1678845 RepID=A0A1D1XPD2_9ARAE
MMRSPGRGSAFGSRKSSSGEKTPERWDISRSSASSGGRRPPPSGRNPVRIAMSAIGACFAPSEVKSERGGDLSEGFNSSISEMSGSSRGSEGMRSGRGVYRSSYNSTQMVPGGMKFTMAEINKATRNFSPSCKIGQGGFGTVYKGKIDDGTFVAIKRAKKIIHQKHLGVEFQSEVQTLARVEHLNLVRFYGYLEHEDERIIVVEYVPSGTLREHLDCMRVNPLDLTARLDIAIDVAHAVTYLHMYTDHPIIHRDIKSSNILLTENLRAKVADFGFARLAPTDSDATHVSTQVKGTAGYLDPEYLRTYQLTEKSDVYSFGVLLVELMTGRRPIEPKRELKERITTKWAMTKFTEGNALKALDPNLTPTPSTNFAMEKVLELALQCLAPTRHSRPAMKRCAEILWSIRKDYREIFATEPLSHLHRSERNSSRKGDRNSS